MSKTVYVNYVEISKLQVDIMQFVDAWASAHPDSPISHKRIVDHFLKEDVPAYSTKNAIGTLIKNYFLRRAHNISNKTFYVQLRRV